MFQRVVLRVFAGAAGIILILSEEWFVKMASTIPSGSDDGLVIGCAIIVAFLSFFFLWYAARGR